MTVRPIWQLSTTLKQIDKKTHNIPWLMLKSNCTIFDLLSYKHNIFWIWNKSSKVFEVKLKISKIAELIEFSISRKLPFRLQAGYSLLIRSVPCGGFMLFSTPCPTYPFDAMGAATSNIKVFFGMELKISITCKLIKFTFWALEVMFHLSLDGFGCLIFRLKPLYGFRLFCCFLLNTFNT